jgi:starch-binding outer membrane protein, SusD/RagB family
MTEMQTLKISFLVLGLALTVVACNKKLEVFPQNNITPEQIQTEADVKAVLFGAYNFLQSPQAFGERWLLASDLLADEGHLNFVGTFQDHVDLTEKDQVSINTLATGMWANAYTIVNVANTVLDKTDVIADAGEKDIVEGEARCIRAIAYYYLINFYALPFSEGNANANWGVPLMLEPVYGYDPAIHKVARSTVEQVYAQIIADLTDAAAKLPEQSDDARLNAGTAQAFLARVHMAMGNYAAAASAANAVISSGAFDLETSYFDVFNNEANSDEYIFGIQQTSQSNSGTTNNGMATFYSARPVGRGDAQVPDSYYANNFEATDDRGVYWYTGVSITGANGTYTGKFMDRYRVIPVVRLAEMYLTRGEANLRNGSSIGAAPLNDINEVRTRSGASALGAVTAQIFIEERFRELAFEGDRLWTLKRAKMNVDGLAFDHDLLVLPIPQREIDVNGNLEQNDGYN